MKKLIRRSFAASVAGAAICMILISFTYRPGAHSFQVYLDSNLVLDQYVKSSMTAPKVWLDPADNAKQLVVKYNECGRTVTGRTLFIKGDKDKVLKEWHFDGESKGYQGSMSCSVKDIIALKQKDALKLYYSSNDFPEGQQIVSLLIGNEKTASVGK